MVLVILLVLGVVQEITISDKSISCSDGTNSYTVSDLKANTIYSFIIRMSYTYTNDEGKSFSGLVSSLWLEGTTSKGAIGVNNPKTSGGFILIVLGIFILACMFLFYTKEEMKSNNYI